ncbi:ATP-dependent DNA helicase [Trichonephila clavipes]|nr:ATP-dependent DNA helicase [Trichonephila clavipes]
MRSVDREDKAGTVLKIPFPQDMVDYNKNMCFMDHFDHLKSLYEVTTERIKSGGTGFSFHFLDLIGMADGDRNFLNNIVTGDEIWCLKYNLESKRQSLERRSPSSPKKASAHGGVSLLPLHRGPTLVAIKLPVRTYQKVLLDFTLDKLAILTLNCQNLRAHQTNFDGTISQNCPLLMLVETWLFNDEYVSIPNFDCCVQFKRPGRHRAAGVAIYRKQKNSHVVTPHMDITYRRTRGLGIVSQDMLGTYVP